MSDSRAIAAPVSIFESSDFDWIASSSVLAESAKTGLLATATPDVCASTLLACTMRFTPRRKVTRGRRVTCPSLTFGQISNGVLGDSEIDCNIGQRGVCFLVAVAGVGQRCRREDKAANHDCILWCDRMLLFADSANSISRPSAIFLGCRFPARGGARSFRHGESPVLFWKMARAGARSRRARRTLDGVSSATSQCQGLFSQLHN